MNSISFAPTPDEVLGPITGHELVELRERETNAAIIAAMSAALTTYKKRKGITSNEELSSDLAEQGVVISRPHLDRLINKKHPTILRMTLEDIGRLLWAIDSPANPILGDDVSLRATMKATLALTWRQRAELTNVVQQRSPVLDETLIDAIRTLADKLTISTDACKTRVEWSRWLARNRKAAEELIGEAQSDFIDQLLVSVGDWKAAKLKALSNPSLIEGFFLAAFSHNFRPDVTDLDVHNHNTAEQGTTEANHVRRVGPKSYTALVFVAIFAIVATSLSMQNRDILLKDNFDDGSFNKRYWNPPPPLAEQAGLAEEPGFMRLVNRGILRTRKEYDEPFDLSFDWKWLRGRNDLDPLYQDILVVSIRTSAEPATKRAWEVEDGIHITFNPFNLFSASLSANFWSICGAGLGFSGRIRRA